MSRIPTPASIEAAPAASRPLLEAVQKMLGTVPNLFRLASHSPAALEGYVGLLGALSRGALPAATRERIALVVAELDGCSYCLSAHTYLAGHVAGLPEAEILAARRGGSSDPKADAAVRFAAQLVRARGKVPADDVAAVRAAGHGEAELVEIVMHVALNVWTNYLNEAFHTEVDFPVVEARRAA